MSEKSRKETNVAAKFTADAPQVCAYDLLRAAISGGHAGNVLSEEEVVKAVVLVFEDFEHGWSAKPKMRAIILHYMYYAKL